MLGADVSWQPFLRYGYELHDLQLRTFAFLVGMADKLVHALEGLYRVRMFGDVIVRVALVRDGDELHDLQLRTFA